MNQQTLSGEEYMNFVYEFYNMLEKDNVSLIYEGEITSQITNAFTTLTETDSSTMPNNPAAIETRELHIVVACLKNIGKQADELQNNNQESNLNQGIFIVRKMPNEYIVTTGNIINNDKIPELTQILNNINHLDKEGLKQLLNKSNLTQNSYERTAELEFIDIATRTGQKLDYEFIPKSENSSFLMLTTLVTIKK